MNIDTTNQNRPHLLGIAIAVALHFAWFSLLKLSSATTPEPEITPPQPIMVEWVSTSKAQKTEQPKAEKIQPKIEQSKPKTQPKPVKTPVKKVQPKIQKTVAQPKSLIASTAPTASAMNVETQEKIEPVTEKTVEKTAEKTDSQTAQATGQNSNNSATVSENAQEPITLPNLNASYLNNPAPIYPILARQNNEQGKVLLRVFVNSAGTVEKMTLKKSSGYERLDEAAKETVEKWRFVPATQGDKKVAAWVVVPISFSLEG